MRGGRAPRLWLFLPLAVALHLLAFALWPRETAGGPNGAGDGGTDLVTLAAADGALSDLVAQWEAPPEAAPVAPTLPAPAFTAMTEFAPSAPDPALPAEAVPEAMPPEAPQMELPAPIADAPPAPVAAPPAPKPPEAKPVPAKPKPPKIPKIVQKPAPGAAAQPPGGGSAGTRAAGAGGGAAAGENGTSPAGSLSPGERRSALAQWGGQIRARIERARRSPAGGGAGRVMLALRVGRDGRLVSVSVSQSAGSALDAAALAAVRAAGRFPPAPPTLAEPSYPFTLPLRFTP